MGELELPLPALNPHAPSTARKYRAEWYYRDGAWYYRVVKGVWGL